jgi:flagellar biosynthesis protein FlhA
MDSQSDSIYRLGIDLGTSRTSVATSTGVRLTQLSCIGYAKDLIARKRLGVDHLVGQEALDNRLALDLVWPLADGNIRGSDDVASVKGAGRVSEVIARFTLDALPGKQMAIDADLNSGVIDQDTARRRREELAQESDFFGSMDGASKFVRGDAIAGLLILIINIVGGIAIGILQHDLSFAEAGRIYVLLTIGDGLVAQLPSLILSLATAIIVTRVTTTQSMTDQAKNQLASPPALFAASGVLLLLGIVPGMPHFIFLSLAGAAAWIAFALVQRESAEVGGESARELAPSPPRELDWEDVHQVDLIGLDIGYGLIPLVSVESGGQLMPRVKGVRKKLSSEFGFLVPPVRIRDNLDLDAESYQILLNGVVRGRGQIKPGRELAINPGQVHGQLAGVKTREPAFGLEAVWIEPSQRDYARTLGYNVVDPSTTIATHLHTLLRSNAAELLSLDETQKLLDKLAEKSPKLVSDLVPDKVSLGVVTRVLQNLLTEGVTIRDMRTIVETLSKESELTKDADPLTALVRPRLGRIILQGLTDVNAPLSAITLEPRLEQLLHNVLQQSNASKGLMIEPKLAESLFDALRQNVRMVEDQGYPAVLVVSPAIRPWLAQIVRPRIPDMTVLSYNEIPEDQVVRVLSTVEISMKN